MYAIFVCLCGHVNIRNKVLEMLIYRLLYKSKKINYMLTQNILHIQ